MIMAAPTGALMKKPARQDTQSASAPPMTRPRLAPIPAVAPGQRDRLRPLASLGETRGQQRQRRRRDDRRPYSLHPASRDQPPPGRREPDQQRRQREHRQPEDEHPAAAQQVTRPRPTHQDHR
jgi:hypothetical protein